LLVEIPDGLTKVLIDAEMIQRVLINLLENAVKYTPPGGEICLAQRPNPIDHAVVQDTGPGIPPAEMERIFDKFTRLNRAGNPKGMVGLGVLSSGRGGMAGALGGEYPNLGARFATLPIVRP
jgi:two-component system sensor histidine kinase KdpD